MFSNSRCKERKTPRKNTSGNAQTELQAISRSTITFLLHVIDVCVSVGFDVGIKGYQLSHCGPLLMVVLFVWQTTMEVRHSRSNKLTLTNECARQFLIVCLSYISG